ncbi:MAG: FtsW/RodA/SpoVE family cell cycle protein [Erysipelotrichaceae bacterium]|nr:FtsW/RodA/SpoVE family cell cycle protein [Erysipelotrichaceae bacterium]
MENKKAFSPIRMPSHSDKVILYSTLVLAIFGLIMVTSSSMGIAVGNNTYLIKIVAKQVVFTVAGYIAMIFAAKQFSFKLLKEYVNFILVVTVLGLLFALFFPDVGGARAWIKIPFPGIEVTLQPSEFSKISIICVIAAYLGDIKRILSRNIDVFKAPLTFVLFSVFIVILLQKDMGSGVVMFGIACICFLIPKHKQLRNIQLSIIIMILIGSLFGILILSPVGEGLIYFLPLQPYQINRFLSSINPFIDRYATGYQLINGLISFASGGFFGVGFGNSVRKYTNFPAANTDYILAIVVEELGFVGFLLIFIPFILIIGKLFQYAFKIKSEKAQIVLIGTAMYMFIHFLLNVGGVTGLIPLTGVPLLMISSGGSSTLSLMMAIGISQAVINQYELGEIQ